MQMESFHWLGHHGIWAIIIHSKYFPVSDWLKPHVTITSCCSPNLERIFVILNQWRQKWSPLQIIQPLTSKVEPTADYSTVDRKNLGTRLWFWWAEKQRAKRRNSITNGEIFWMNNKAIIEFGFCRIWRILQISRYAPRWLSIISYPTRAHGIIVNYSSAINFPLSSLVKTDHVVRSRSGTICQ